MTSFLGNNIWCLKILKKPSYTIYAAKTFSINTSVDSVCNTDMANFDIMFFFWSCRRTEDPQEEVPILQISDPRTRKGIFFQCVHQQRETHATVTDAQPHRPTSEDLVSKPSHEGEEVKQRQITVLHIQPSSLGVKSSTVLSLPSSAAGPTVFTDFPGCTLCSMQRRRCWVVRFKFEDMSFKFSPKKAWINVGYHFVFRACFSRGKRQLDFVLAQRTQGPQLRLISPLMGWNQQSMRLAQCIL